MKILLTHTRDRGLQGSEKLQAVTGLMASHAPVRGRSQIIVQRAVSETPILAEHRKVISSLLGSILAILCFLSLE